jgi:hypothetical protein
MRKPEEVPSEGLAALVEATARLGNTSGVQKLLAMAREVGEPPSAALYESLLKLANTRFYWDMALALLREAEADAVPVTGPMLGATLYSCLQADVRACVRVMSCHVMSTVRRLVFGGVRTYPEAHNVP